jgi:hypothetical protein
MPIVVHHEEGSSVVIIDKPDCVAVFETPGDMNGLLSAYADNKSEEMSFDDVVDWFRSMNCVQVELTPDVLREILIKAIFWAVNMMEDQ